MKMRKKKNHPLQSAFNGQDPKRDQTVDKGRGLQDVRRDTNTIVQGPAVEMTEDEIQNTTEEVLKDVEDLIREKRGMKALIGIDLGLKTVRGHQRVTGRVLHQGYLRNYI